LKVAELPLFDFDADCSANQESDKSENRVVQAVEEFMAAMDAGNAPVRSEFLARYPDIAELLGKCLDSLEFICGVMPNGRNGVNGAILQSTSSQAIECLLPPMKNYESEPSSFSALHPASLGDFRIVREIGRGGMGVVYEAEQISLQRRVALKVLPFAAVLDPRRLQRFRTEAMSAAQLHHTNIVPVYSVGCDRGIHYYAMQYVEGSSLDQVLRQLRGVTEAKSNSHTSVQTVITPNDFVETANITNLSTDHELRSPRYFRTVAELGIQAAEALECAHQNGITHRDIKPSNLILDQQSRLWIADFGLAHAENDENLTLTGELLGTLRYMSPEQIANEQGRVDHRSDIYSLGASLYELLTLQPAFTESLRPTLIRHILEIEPRAPRRLDPSIPPEMETIVVKALEKDPADRYGSAQALADDLRRFLDHRPLAARRATRWERCRKWRRRNQALVTTATIILVMAAMGVSLSIGLVVNERNKALYERKLRESQETAFRLSEVAKRQNEYAANINLASRAWSLSKISKAKDYLLRCVPNASHADFRSVEWRYLSRVCNNVPPPMALHEGQIFSAEFSLDGQFLATGGEDALRIWEYPSGKPILCLPEAAGLDSYGSFSPDGKWLVASGDNGTVTLLNTTNWARAKTFDRSMYASFSPDGSWLGMAGRRMQGDVQVNEIRLYDASNYEEHWLFEAGPNLAGGAISPDGATLATFHDDGFLRLYDVRERKLLSTLREKNGTRLLSMAFSPTEPVFAVGVDAQGGVLLGRRQGSSASIQTHFGNRSVTSLAFSADGRRLAAGSRESVIEIWDIEGDELRLHNSTLLRCDSICIRCLRVAPDGHTFIAAGDEGAVWRFGLDHPSEFQRIANRPFTGCFAFNAQGDQLIAGAHGGVGAYSLDSLEELAWLPLENEESQSIAIDSGGRFIAVGTRRGKIALWDGVSPTPLSTLGPYKFPEPNDNRDFFVDRLAISPDAKSMFFLAGNPDPPMILLPHFINREAQKLDISPLPPIEAMVDFEYSPDGKWIAVDKRNEGFQVWNAASKTQQFEIDEYVGIHSFSSDSRLLAVSSSNLVRIWRTDSWGEVATFPTNPGEVQSLSFSSDNLTLAVGTSHGSIKLWSVSTGRELMTFAEDFKENAYARFSPDGKILVACGRALSDAYEFRFWRLEE
jgi:WD40 repeat protein